jgi:hypothetical protein
MAGGCRSAVDERRHRVRRGPTRRRGDHFDPIDQHLRRAGRGGHGQRRDRLFAGRRRPRGRRRRGRARHDGRWRGGRPRHWGSGNRRLHVSRRRRHGPRDVARPGRGRCERRRGVAGFGLGQPEPAHRLGPFGRSLRQADGRTGRRRLRRGGPKLRSARRGRLGLCSGWCVAPRARCLGDRGRCVRRRRTDHSREPTRLGVPRWSRGGDRRSVSRTGRRRGRRSRRGRPGRGGPRGSPRDRCGRRRRVRDLDLVQAGEGVRGPDRAAGGSRDEAACRRRVRPVRHRPSATRRASRRLRSSGSASIAGSDQP